MRKLVQYCQWKFSSTKSVPAVISKYYHILFILCRRIPYCLADLSSQAVLSVGKLEKGNDAGFKKIQVDVLSCHTSLADREAKLDIGIVLEGIICELGEFATHVQTCGKTR